MHRWDDKGDDTLWLITPEELTKIPNGAILDCIDGKQYPYENPQLAEFIASSMVLPDVMETLTFKDGKMNSKGMRRLSEDLTTLYVEQIMYLPDGQELVNKSEYHRML